MARVGLFISFEGGEGAGKTTVIEHAMGLLRRHDVPFVATREPGGTPLGEALRQIVLEPAHGAVAPTAELLLMFAARAQHAEELIRPSLARGHWVVTDRFVDASYAYQGGGRGIAEGAIVDLERIAIAGLRPDRTYLLDVPVDVGRERIARRGNIDRIESEPEDFFERVRKAYRRRAAVDPARFRVLDASQPLPDVLSCLEADLSELAQTWKSKRKSGPG